MKLLDLFLGYLDLFQARGDLIESQEAPLLALGDQRTQLLHLNDGCFVTQQHCRFVAHGP